MSHIDDLMKDYRRYAIYSWTKFLIN